ncbi:Uncharacterised protein [Klebsiella michiganensis]|nr:Uncharacterised protein [Klebsiella michiganensis]
MTSLRSPRYIALVNYFVEARGTQPHFYDIEYEKRGKTLLLEHLRSGVDGDG